MPFTGFNLKYPDYEVITPQTNQSFKVRSLNVQEEEKLKGSFVTPAKITDHLNRCIYECLTSKPDEITSFNDFLKNVTLKDREALLYGLYHITYEEIRNYDIKCSSCRKDFSVTVKASSTFSFNGYPENDIIGKKIAVPLKISEGVTVYLKQPTLADEINSINDLVSTPGVNLDLITETLVIDKFVQEAKGEVPEKTYDDRGDIIDAYLSLPAMDKRIIHKEYLENFGQYGIVLKMKVFCTHCGSEDIIDIDLVENFFRMVYSS